MRRRHRVRTALAALSVLVALTGLVGCSGAEPAKAPSTPLRILLVNDDGWNAPGIVAARDALRRAGHRVTVVAPLTDRSSTGTAVTLAGDVQLGRPTRDPDTWTVSGTAADATLVGISAVMGNAWPDLVISGINSRPSVGLSAMHSGAVGAAFAAAGRFPAVAVSTDVRDPRRARPVDFVRAADFTVRMVAAIRDQRVADTPLLPLRTVLNVNYPGGPDPARKVVSAPTSDVPVTSVSYRPGSKPGSVSAVTRSNRTPEPISDVAAFARGQVTLTDLSADPDRSAPPPRTAVRLASGLSP